MLLVQIALTARAEESATEDVIKAIPKKALKKLNTNDYSDAIPQSEFSNYGAAQPVQMPKAGRLQFKLGATTLTNDVYNNGVGLNLGLLYHINQSWGIGIGGSVLSLSQKSQAKNIQDIQQLNVENVPALKKSADTSLYYSPIYGKWSFADDKIVQFEIYFSGGAAEITDQFDKKYSASRASFGQLISLTESSSLDINFEWLFYNSKNINDQEKSNQSMLLSVGYGFLWPEAGNR